MDEGYLIRILAYIYFQQKLSRTEGHGMISLKKKHQKHSAQQRYHSELKDRQSFPDKQNPKMFLTTKQPYSKC